MMMVMIIMMLPAAQVSAQRINEVLETPESLTQGRPDTMPRKPALWSSGTSPSTIPPRTGILSHITFQAKRGETVAFIGATGTGKTTLVSLAARFYDASSGQVLIDGRDVRDYSFEALYDRIGYITQKAVLFAGDIRDNILFGESTADSSDPRSTRPGAGSGHRVRGLPPRGARRADRRGRHQLLRRPEAAAVHRPGAGPPAGDPHLRRLLLRAGLQDGREAPGGPRPRACGHHLASSWPSASAPSATRTRSSCWTRAGPWASAPTTN